MNMFFAGPVTFEIPTVVAIILYVIFGALAVGVITLIISIFKYIKQLSSKKDVSQPPSSYNHSNGSTRLDSNVTGSISSQLQQHAISYVRAFLLDLGFVAVIMGIFTFMTTLGIWDNEAWHNAVISGTAVFIMARLIPRLIFRKSLGEKILKARVSWLTLLMYSLTDLLIAVLLVFFVSSL